MGRFRAGAFTLTPVVMGAIPNNAGGWFSGSNGMPLPADRFLPVTCLHVEGPGVSLLADACAPGIYPGAETGTGSAAACLQAAGIDPGRITHVLLTHGHHDHFCGVSCPHSGEPVFPAARHIFPAGDWTRGTLTEAAQAADGSAADPRPMEMLHRRGLLDLWNGEDMLPAGLSLIAAPGETDGHCCLRVSSDGQTFLFLADLFHVEAEFACAGRTPVWAAPEKLAHSRRRLASLAAETGAHCLCSHISGLLTQGWWHPFLQN
jgi:glyoxylase-like metal-dependent hydrolase (beta-lactamase superfamily II)